MWKILPAIHGRVPPRCGRCSTPIWRARCGERLDLVTIAANPGLVYEFLWDLPVECAVHAANGPDGADLALLAHAAPEFVAGRASRLVIGSGDHIFIERALQARAAGVGVLVVSRPSAIHAGWRAHRFPIAALDAAVPVAA